MQGPEPEYKLHWKFNEKQLWIGLHISQVAIFFSKGIETLYFH